MNSASLAPLPNVANAALPESYERAKTALERCTNIDECKEWADKAAALASYAKQAEDETLHNLATRIQARAVRRCGELLKPFQTGPSGGRPKGNGGDASPVSQREAAAKARMSKDQEKTAIRVANVSAEDFEAAVDGEHPATVTRLAELGKTSKPAAPGFVAATHAIGTIKEFAKFCEAHSPEFVADGICDHEVPKVAAQVEVIGKWLLALVANLKKVGAA